MSDEIDYSKLSDAELERIAGGGEPQPQTAGAPSVMKVPESASGIHPALGAIGGAYLGSKAAGPIAGWYGAKAASDIGDIASAMKAGQPIPSAASSPAPAAPAPSKEMTGGRKWNERLTGYSMPGSQMDKEDLKKMKEIAKIFEPTGSLPGGSISEGGIFLNAKDTAERARKLEHEAQLEARIRAAEQTMQQRAAAAAERAIKSPVTSKLSRIVAPAGAMGKMFNIGAPVLAGAAAGAEGMDAINRWNRGEYLRSIIGGIGAGGSAASMFPHPVARIGGSAVGVAAPAINAAIDYFVPPEDKPMANSVMQGYAEGGRPTPIGGERALMKAIEAARTIGRTNMQSRPGKYLTSEMPNMQYVDKSYFSKPDADAEYQQSTKTLNLQRNPTGMTAADLMTLGHEFQHHKDNLAGTTMQDAAMLQAIQNKINRYKGQILDSNNMPMDAAARNALTQQSEAPEVMGQLAGYEAGLPAGMNITQSGLGKMMTPQEKAMMLRRMNPTPPGVDAVVGGYADGGHTSDLDVIDNRHPLKKQWDKTQMFVNPINEKYVKGAMGRLGYGTEVGDQGYLNAGVSGGATRMALPGSDPVTRGNIAGVDLSYSPNPNHTFSAGYQSQAPASMPMYGAPSAATMPMTQADMMGRGMNAGMPVMAKDRFNVGYRYNFADGGLVWLK